MGARTGQQRLKLMHKMFRGHHNYSNFFNMLICGGWRNCFEAQRAHTIYRKQRQMAKIARITSRRIQSVGELSQSRNHMKREDKVKKTHLNYLQSGEFSKYEPSPAAQNNRPTSASAPLSQICRQHEKPLVLQLCRLVRGFTHPASYFADDGQPSSCMNDRNRGGGRRRGTAGEDGESREDLALFSVDEFSAEMVRIMISSLLAPGRVDRFLELWVR